MRYRCVLRQQYETWIKEGNVYEGELVVSPKEFAGGEWLYLPRTEDRHPAYVKVSQFVPYREVDSLGV